MQEEQTPFMPKEALQPIASEDLYRLRIFYRKRGRLAMLSHLEVLRAMERTVRRAGLPFAVTQGFSPHMKTSFGSALPVGVGGLYEMFDVFLLHFVDPGQALESLRQASVPDLQVDSIEYVDVRSPAPNIGFPISVFEAVLDGEITSLEVPECVTVVRKNKERVLRVADYLVHGPELSVDGIDRPIIEFALMVKQDGSLRPDAFLGALLVKTGVHAVSLTRIRQLPVGFIDEES